MVKVILKCDRCGKEEAFDAKHSDICNNVTLGYTGWAICAKSDNSHEDLCQDCEHKAFNEYVDQHPELFDD